ncbi:hypothetical protein BRADI_1g50063v3 [Brachypodium distachyon]|uniref:Uncharacterized protein n=1 Tax=Brachypodium distachyon TaxID=15368 RepID=A0A2K2DQN7_BRADI|nr:hypothetical protein BRADI_1g50063v3 [Brachypodium distachyon]
MVRSPFLTLSRLLSCPRLTRIPIGWLMRFPAGFLRAVERIGFKVTLPQMFQARPLIPYNQLLVGTCTKL